MIRPNQDVVVAATILQLRLHQTFTIQSVIRLLVDEKHAKEISTAKYTFTRIGTHNIILKVRGRDYG